ncbi:hypothetical protein, partial [Bradyrhizobium sp. AS23.2]|uniref:hypothetical protein n=1 Tax=Bradyrhizobium sp. AS23.2 TaxID=1680155 RepID=UPI001AD84F43
IDAAAAASAPVIRTVLPGCLGRRPVFAAGAAGNKTLAGASTAIGPGGGGGSNASCEKREHRNTAQQPPGKHGPRSSRVQIVFSNLNEI